MARMASSDLRLVRTERIGEVHVIAGATVHNRGRDISGTRCDALVAGRPFFGEFSDVTCTFCRSALIVDEERDPGRARRLQEAPRRPGADGGMTTPLREQVAQLRMERYNEDGSVREGNVDDDYIYGWNDALKAVLEAIADGGGVRTTEGEAESPSAASPEPPPAALREQVAREIAGRWADVYTRQVADAAIGVVLAAVTEQIGQVRDKWSGGGMFNTDELDEVLAVVARLGEDAA